MKFVLKEDNFSIEKISLMYRVNLASENVMRFMHQNNRHMKFVLKEDNLSIEKFSLVYRVNLASENLMYDYFWIANRFLVNR